MKKEDLLLKIADIEEKIKALPRGSITYKTIRGKKQPYLQWREYGKVKSKYIKLNEREQIFMYNTTTLYPKSAKRIPRIQ